MKQALLGYNRQDCEALELVANTLVDLHRAAPSEGRTSRTDIVITSEMKRESPFGFKRNEFMFPDVNRRPKLTPDRRPKLTPCLVVARNGSARPGGAGRGCAAGASAGRFAV